MYDSAAKRSKRIHKSEKLVFTQALGKNLTQYPSGTMRTRYPSGTMSTHEGHKENEFSTKQIVVFTIPVKLFRGRFLFPTPQAQ
jgi:hypothetical protein